MSQDRELLCLQGRTCGRAAFDTSFSRAMPLCAGLVAIGASIAFGMPQQTAAASRRPHGRTHSRLMDPPPASRFAHHQTVG
ncbi:hypothetical protein ACQP2T_06905 [Nonomuraea sp. CA-143628]|uniref:hypothetical protein n=1 Tax=Nonomuraea sp. CA-143628 TaxID=3239997 RepID=UPI003D94E36D